MIVEERLISALEGLTHAMQLNTEAMRLSARSPALDLLVVEAQRKMGLGDDGSAL
jgi:hypothetical protein